jgi:staphylococcal nuclease domain-containing protein 1
MPKLYIYSTYDINRIFLPKDNQVLTLVLAGIRAPRTARNSSEKSEPFGQEASDYATRHYMQRDIEFEVDTVDKAGGFIGSLYVNKTENAALALVKEGLASVHGYSAEGLSWVRQLYDSEVGQFWTWWGRYADRITGRREEGKERCKCALLILDTDNQLILVQIWKEYDEEAEKAAEAANNVDDSAPLKTNFMDIIISDVRPAANLTFSVQILNTEGQLP